MIRHSEVVTRHRSPEQVAESRRRRDHGRRESGFIGGIEDRDAYRRLGTPGTVGTAAEIPMVVDTTSPAETA